MQTKRVLIVGTDPDARGALAQGHRDAGYLTLEAATELVALEKANLEQPSLIVVRVDEQALDGWTTIKRLGESPRTEGIPVLAVSAAPSSGEQRTAALLGCSGLAPLEPVEALVTLTLGAVGKPVARHATSRTPRVIRRRYAGR